MQKFRTFLRAVAEKNSVQMGKRTNGQTDWENFIESSLCGSVVGLKPQISLFFKYIVRI